MRWCVVILSLLISSTEALAICPEDVLILPYHGTSATAEPEFDITSPAGDWVRGDHRTGIYSLHHMGTLAGTALIARDRFEVTGVPPGTMVSVTAKLLIEGWATTGSCGGTGCCGELDVFLKEGTDSSVVALYGQTFAGQADFSGSVSIDLNFFAGTPRDLEVKMVGHRCPGGSHTVDGTVRLVFIGSDPQAAVVSCKGFGPSAVPVRTRSWGEIKTLYR